MGSCQSVSIERNRTESHVGDSTVESKAVLMLKGLDLADNRHVVPSLLKVARLSSLSDTIRRIKGNWDNEEHRIWRKYPKSDAIKDKLLSALQDHLHFQHLDKADLEAAVSWMKQDTRSTGAFFAEEGKLGHHMYVLMEGRLRVSSREKGVMCEELPLQTVFGDLSILYNVPRLASITCVTDCTAYSLSAKQLRYLVSRCNAGLDQKRKDVRKMLETITILQDQKAAFLDKVSRRCECIVCHKGDVIFEADTEPEMFYMVYKGSITWQYKEYNAYTEALDDTLNSSNRTEKSIPAQDVEAGGYFGEMSLITGGKRVSNAIASDDNTVLLALSKSCFHELLTPLTKEMSVQRTCRLLETLHIFQHISKGELYQLATSFKSVSYSAGTRVVKQGDKKSFDFYLVRQGKLSISINGIHVGEYNPGNYFGEKSIVQGEPRAATITAKTACQLLKLGKEDFLKSVELSDVDNIIARYNSTDEGGTSDGFPEMRVEEFQQEYLIGKGNFSYLWAMTRKIDATGSSRLKSIRLKTAHNGEDKSGSSRLTGAATASSECNTENEETDEPQKYTWKVYSKDTVELYRLQTLLIREKGILAVMHHPLIPKYYGTLQTATHAILVTECIEHGDLFSRIYSDRIHERPSSSVLGTSRNPGMSNEEAVFCAACIVDVLVHLHARDVALRDFKPELLTYDRHGYLRVTDFGFAKAIDPGQRTRTFCGTVEYMAPEMVLGRGHDHRVDHWCLGILIYEMLVGRSPFIDKSSNDKSVVCRNIVHGKLIFPFYMGHDGKTPLPSSAVEFVRQLLHHNPSHRLGRHSDSTALTKAPWFQNRSGINFVKLHRKELKAPYIPTSIPPLSTSNVNKMPSGQLRRASISGSTFVLGAKRTELDSDDDDFVDAAIEDHDVRGAETIPAISKDTPPANHSAAPSLDGGRAHALRSPSPVPSSVFEVPARSLSPDNNSARGYENSSDDDYDSDEEKWIRIEAKAVLGVDSYSITQNVGNVVQQELMRSYSGLGGMSTRPGLGAMTRSKSRERHTRETTGSQGDLGVCHEEADGDSDDYDSDDSTNIGSNERLQAPPRWADMEKRRKLKEKMNMSTLEIVAKSLEKKRALPSLGLRHADGGRPDASISIKERVARQRQITGARSTSVSTPESTLSSEIFAENDMDESRKAAQCVWANW